MSTTPTTPVTPAAPTTTAKPNGFESFFTKFGNILKNIANVAVNLGNQEAPVIEPLLPPTAAAGLARILGAASSQVAAADAKYAQIGASTVPYAVKVAEAVAVGGEGVLAIIAEEGFTIADGEVATLFSAAGTIASTLNFTGLTAAPTVPSPAPATTPAS